MVEVLLVEVAFWVVILAKVVEALNTFCPEKVLAPENVLLLASKVEEAPEVLRQAPAIAKQPWVRLKPFCAVLVALPVRASWSAETPPAKVLVP